MKSDIITIESSGRGFADALAETEKVAIHDALNPKQAMHLRLLAEEMTGMLRSIVGRTQAKFWIESNRGSYELHLATHAITDEQQRAELLKVSTSGKNAAKKGFMQKLLEVIFCIGDSAYPLSSSYEGGYIYDDLCSFETPPEFAAHPMPTSWSLNAYRSSFDEPARRKSEKWDELERSIVAKLADEVQVSLNGSDVETVIIKHFDA